MLRYNFDRVFMARGIHHPFTYLKNAGFSITFASRVKNRRVARLNTDMLERLCMVLRCTPNDLMEWIPDDELDEKHPLQRIRRSDLQVDISRTLNSIPIDQLSEIDQMIKAKIAERNQ